MSVNRRQAVKKLGSVNNNFEVACSFFSLRAHKEITSATANGIIFALTVNHYTMPTNYQASIFLRSQEMIFDY